MTRLAVSLLATLAAVTAVTTLAAQEPSRARTPENFRIWLNGEEVTGRFMPLIQRRARLGVTVRLEAQDTDGRGAYLESVTPGGPGAKAGLQAGDLVVRLDGTSVLTPPEQQIEADRSAPGLRLIELAAKLAPDDTITVEFLRGEARRTATLITGNEPIISLEGNAFDFRFRSGDREWNLPGTRLERLPEGARIEAPRIELRRLPGEVGGPTFFGGPLFALELAPMDADLGWYFGTGEGVLVIRAPENSSLGLKSGDVVLSIDGRKPSSPSNLLRILRSYEGGEGFRLEVMRQKQRQAVNGRLGRNDGR